MSEGRYIDRAELLNRLATVNTEDWEYRAKVYKIIGELEGLNVEQENEELKLLADRINETTSSRIEAKAINGRTLKVKSTSPFDARIVTEKCFDWETLNSGIMNPVDVVKMWIHDMNMQWRDMEVNRNE